jgi:Bacterial mobilisation protein (MobC)
LHPQKQNQKRAVGKKKMNEPITQTPKAKSGSQTRQRSKLAALPCTPAELEDVKKRAEKCGLNVSGYLRALVFGKDTPQPKAARRIPVELAALSLVRYELRKIGGNFNQIAHHLNQGKDFDKQAFDALCAEHAAVLRTILAAFGRKPP